MNRKPPQVRTVDQLSGEIAPGAEKFFNALADADDAAETIGLLIAERDVLAQRIADMRNEYLDALETYGELRARLDEALTEVADLRADLAVANNKLIGWSQAWADRP